MKKHEIQIHALKKALLKAQAEKEALLQRFAEENGLTVINTQEQYQTMKKIVDKVPYVDEFNDFEAAIRETLGWDFSQFNTSEAWFQEQEPNKFVKIVQEVKERLSIDDKGFPDENDIQSFYTELFKKLVEDEGDIQEPESNILLFPESLTIHNSPFSAIKQNILLGIVEKPLYETKAFSQCPRSVVAVKQNFQELEEVSTPIDKLLDYMVHYMFFKFSKKPFKHLFGIILDLDETEMVWIKNFESGKLPKPEQVRLFSFRWALQNLKTLISNVCNGKKRPRPQPGASNLELLEYECEYESLYQFFVFCKFIARTLCAKTQ